MSKLEHQRREEEEEARKIANELSHPGPSAHNVTPIQQFRGVNEDNLEETNENVEDQEGSADQDVSESDESIEVRPPESDTEQLRDDEQEYELNPEFYSSESEEEEEVEFHELASPEREVTFTPAKPSKRSRHNPRRRKQKRIQQDQVQHEETKKKLHIKSRLYKSQKSPFLRIGPQQKPPTTSTDILTDSDDRMAKQTGNHKDQQKKRRSSQESVEEVDSRGRKLSKNKTKYRRQ